MQCFLKTLCLTHCQTHLLQGSWKAESSELYTLRCNYIAFYIAKCLFPFGSTLNNSFLKKGPYSKYNFTLIIAWTCVSCLLMFTNKNIFDGKIQKRVSMMIWYLYYVQYIFCFQSLHFCHVIKIKPRLSWPMWLFQNLAAQTRGTQL